MPIARIEDCRAHLTEQVAAMVDAVYRAQREALKVPADDRHIRYFEHAPRSAMA